MPVVPACVVQAAHHYQVPPALVRSVLHVEGGGRKVIHHNRNGTDDLGWMQINSTWLPKLAAYGIDRKTLLTNACINIQVGTWILARYHRRFPDWRKAVQAYNAGPANLPAGKHYAHLVLTDWRKHADPTIHLRMDPILAVSLPGSDNAVPPQGGISTTPIVIIATED
jgi:Soluble lytic murein transglycosylase and related regulatory proteins (some contain LysM/invasin domains)